MLRQQEFNPTPLQTDFRERWTGATELDATTRSQQRLAATGDNEPGQLLPIETSVGALSGTRTYHGNITGRNMSDVYRFSLNTASHFNLALTDFNGYFNHGGNIGDANVRLIRDANNNGIVDADEVVASSTLSGDRDESINLNSLAAGSYYIQIYRGSGDMNYTLTLSTGTPSRVLPTEVDIGTLSNPVSYWGRVNSNDTADVYRFNLGFTSQLNLGLTDMSGDANVRLIRDMNGDGFVSNAEVIATSAFSGNHDEAINYAFLNPGNYFIQVYRGSSDTNFTLRLSATHPPDPSPVIPTEVNIGELNGTRTFTDRLSLTDAADVYRFSLGSTSNFTLGLTGLSQDGDVRVIHDTNRNNIVDAGDEIARSGNYGHQNEAIDLAGLAAGIYFVQVYRRTGNTTNYTLNLTATPGVGVELEPNNSLNTANYLGTLNDERVFSGSVSVLDDAGNGDDDVYRFSLGTTSNLDLSISNTPLFDGATSGVLMHVIRDANHNGLIDAGEVIDQTIGVHIPDFVSDRITLPGLGAGDYFVVVDATSGFYPPPLSYDYFLKLSATPGSGAEQEPNDSLSQAQDINPRSGFFALNTLNGTRQFKGALSSSDVNDYYRFSLPTTSNFSLSLNGLTQNADVQLIRDLNDNQVIDSGDVIGSAATSGTRPETIAVSNLEAGNYFVRVYTPGGTNTDYTLVMAAEANA